MSEERIKAFKAAVEAEIGTLNKDQARKSGRGQRELNKLRIEIDRAVNFILQGRSSPAVEAKLVELESRKAALEAETSVPAPTMPSINLPADWLESYRHGCDRLEEALADPTVKDAAMTAIRDLIDKIVLTPTLDGSDLKIELHGAITELLALSGAAAEEGPRADGLRGAQLSGVAGTRNQRMLPRVGRRIPRLAR